MFSTTLLAKNQVRFICRYGRRFSGEEPPTLRDASVLDAAPYAPSVGTRRASHDAGRASRGVSRRLALGTDCHEFGFVTLRRGRGPRDAVAAALVGYAHRLLRTPRGVRGDRQD